MKHVYSGSELRSRGTMPAGGPPPKAPPKADTDPSGPAARGLLVLVIALLLVLLAGLAAFGWWAWNSRPPAAPSPAGQEGSGTGNHLNPAPADGRNLASLDSYLKPSPLFVRQMFEIVKNSEHVQGNNLYRDSLDRVRFAYDEDNGLRLPESSKTDSGIPSKICTYVPSSVRPSGIIPFIVPVALNPVYFTILSPVRRK